MRSPTARCSPRSDVNASGQDETIAFLASPGAFGGQGPVRRIDTHFSVVTMAGDRVLKLKRAICSPLVDHSTPELRHRACLVELARNRRTAPSLYLDVLPVTRDSRGALHLAGEGKAVDWVVLMRPFDEGSLFTELAQNGRLTFGLIDRTADAIANFHESAEPAQQYGGIEDMRWIIEGNIEALDKTPPASAAPGDVSALATASRAALQRHGDLLEERRSSGRTRHCHGDLHLGNLCLVEGAPTLFDAIEFNDRLACCDLLYDLAFLVMDLWARGLRHEANRILNRYLWRTADWQGLPLLPLFLSTRAAVRAKTSVWSAALQEDPARADEQARQAGAYLDLALEALRRPAPSLLALGGLSGSGKTTLAMALAPERGCMPGALVVRSDIVRKQQAGIAFEQRLERDSYSPESAAAVYAAVGSITGAALDAGLSAIADAVFLKDSERSAIAEVAAARGLRFDALWLEAPHETLTHRVEQRRGDASDADAAVVAFQAHQGTASVAWPRVETCREAGDVVARARALT